MHNKYVKNELKITTPEATQFAEMNYCLIKGAVAIHILDLIEEYMKKRGDRGVFKKEPMFTKVVNNEMDHDHTRQMFNCSLDWVMYFLIAVPVTLALAKHGLLHIVGDVKKRSAQVVTYIVSPEHRGDPMKRLQAFHEDFASYLAEFFKCAFGLSVLVGCVEGSVVHLIPKSYGGENEVDDWIKEGRFEKIVLQRGEALVMGPGLIHRGTGYVVRNSRLFVAFLGGASKAANFFFTYNVFNISTGGRKRKVSSG